MYFLHPMLLPKIFKMAYKIHIKQCFKESNNSNNNRNNNGTIGNKGEEKIWVRKSHGNGGYT